VVSISAILYCGLFLSIEFLQLPCNPHRSPLADQHSGRRKDLILPPNKPPHRVFVRPLEPSVPDRRQNPGRSNIKQFAHFGRRQYILAVAHRFIPLSMNLFLYDSKTTEILCKGKSCKWNGNTETGKKFSKYEEKYPGLSDENIFGKYFL
jgi:hypothetical protein